MDIYFVLKAQDNFKWNSNLNRVSGVSKVYLMLISFVSEEKYCSMVNVGVTYAVSFTCNSQYIKNNRFSLRGHTNCH